MKRADFEVVEQLRPNIDGRAEQLVERLTAELEITTEQAAALCLSSIASRYFPEHDSENSIVTRLEVREGGSVAALEGVVFTARPIDLVNDTVLHIQGHARPFDDAVEAIVFSDDSSQVIAPGLTY